MSLTRFIIIKIMTLMAMFPDFQLINLYEFILPITQYFFPIQTFACFYVSFVLPITMINLKFELQMFLIGWLIYFLVSSFLKLKIIVLVMIV
jgi:hypothetical protein